MQGAEGEAVGVAQAGGLGPGAPGPDRAGRRAGAERHLDLAGAGLGDADVDLQAALGLDDIAQAQVGHLVLAAGDGELQQDDGPVADAQPGVRGGVQAGPQVGDEQAVAATRKRASSNR
ncbi:hypothetical protein [Streptomyces lydicus]|uniref:hypothetical protein n=1 Tax=Streptomyces lydicus TaxID=47763 RepID=UPI0034229DE0